jgi:hypothetical protein
MFLTLSPPAGESDRNVSERITLALVEPLIDTVADRWIAAGADAKMLDERLDNIQYRVVDLPPTRLAAALPARDLVLVDLDAAGIGWYTDISPPPLGETRVDLVTALTHEIGHLLGLPDLSPRVYSDDIMTALITPGMRRTPTPLSLPSGRLPLETWRYVVDEASPLQTSSRMESRSANLNYGSSLLAVDEEERLRNFVFDDYGKDFLLSSAARRRTTDYLRLPRNGCEAPRLPTG